MHLQFLILLPINLKAKSTFECVFCAVLNHSIMSDCATPGTGACQAPLSMGILQARILQWVATTSSKGSSQYRDRTQVSCIAGGFFTVWVKREAQCVFYTWKISNIVYFRESDPKFTPLNLKTALSSFSLLRNFTIFSLN